MRGAVAVAVWLALVMSAGYAASANAAQHPCWRVGEEGVSRYGQIEVFKNTNLEGPDVFTSCWRPTGRRRVFLRTPKEGPGSTERFAAGPQAAGPWMVWELISPVSGGKQAESLHSYNALTGRRGPVVSFGVPMAGGGAAHPQPEDNGFGVFEDLVIASDGWYAWATFNGTGLYAPDGKGSFTPLDSAASPPGFYPLPLRGLSVHGTIITWTHDGHRKRFNLARLAEAPR